MKSSPVKPPDEPPPATPQLESRHTVTGFLGILLYLLCLAIIGMAIGLGFTIIFLTPS